MRPSSDLMSHRGEVSGESKKSQKEGYSYPEGPEMVFAWMFRGFSKM